MDHSIAKVADHITNPDYLWEEYNTIIVIVMPIMSIYYPTTCIHI